MRLWLKSLGLLLLLMVAQQGAVVHEISHFAGIDGTEFKVSGGAADATCALCPTFAQVVTPAFTHTFQIPTLVVSVRESLVEPQDAAINQAAPRPRNRGPPA